MDKSKELLEEQIVRDLEKIKDMPEGPEKETAVKNLEKLYKLKIDEIKNEDEISVKEKAVYADIEKNDYDRTIKEKSMSENKRSHLIDSCIEILKIAIPAALYGAFLHKGFKFEMDGIYSSKTFSNLLSKINLFKH